MPLFDSNLIEDPDEKYVAAREVIARLGDRWSLHVMDFLSGPPQRFNEIRRGLKGISQRMLTLTLRGLERDGLVLRRVFAVRPLQVEYALTDLGRSLLAAATPLIRWTEHHWREIGLARGRFDEASESQPLAGYFRNRPW
jgi:DNA-binding HxlR family transcriptional regulator